MNIRNFVLSFYQNTGDDVHIQRVERPREAKEFHTHDYYQIYYIAKGSLIHDLETDSSCLSVGDMFIIPPGVVHRIREEEGIVFYSLSFMPKVIEQLSRSAGFAADFLEQIKAEPTRPRVALPAEEMLRVEGIIKQIFLEFEGKSIASDEVVKLYIGILLTLFARNYYRISDALPIPRYGDRRQFIRHCVDYVEQHYFRPLTLESIVREAAISKSEFCKEFRKTTGYSFHRYLNLCRIHKGAELIQKGNKITAVHALCGYEDYATFYRNFVKIMGVSPAQFKNAHAE